MTEKQITMEQLEETLCPGFVRRSKSLELDKPNLSSIASTAGRHSTLDGNLYTVKRTDEQLDLMGWKMDNVEKQMVAPLDSQDVCILNLLKSVSEVRSDYQQLRQELVEVQALQRELSTRLRTQLRLVHGKFARLRQRIANADPPR